MKNNVLFPELIKKKKKNNTKNLHSKPFDEDTLLKLEIFDQYLSEWLPVAISQNHKNTYIFDFFAGSGTDSIGKPGSPLRFLDIINKFRGQIISKKHELNLILNDFDKKKFDNLKTVAQAKYNDLKIPKSSLKLSFVNKDFLDLLNNCFNLINSMNLFILDQNGIKHITKEVLNKLDIFNKSDFIFFISSSYLQRFINQASFKEYHPELNPDELKKTNYTNVHQFVTEYYKTLLPSNSNLKLYPFTIKKGSNIYGLIFGSHHPLGVYKFLSVAWKQDNINGDANFKIDEDIDKQQQQLFPELKMKTKIEFFQSEVENYILSNTRTNKDVYDFTLDHGHIPQHSVEILKKLKNENHITYTSRQPLLTYENCYKNNRIIKYELMQ